MHAHRNTIQHLLAKAPSPEVRNELVAGFGATAYSLRENPNQARPANPHGTNEEDLVGGEPKWLLFTGWRAGAQAAEQYWHDWAELRSEDRETWERAADSHYADVVAPAAMGAAAQTPEPEPVTAKVHGYKQQSDAAMAKVNRCKLLEAGVLAVVDVLFTEMQNEMGDIASDEAAFRNKDFARMSVEQQTAKQEELKARYVEVQNALRWLSIGKTDIEKGFMAINRSIFRPARVEVQVKDNEPKA